MKKVLVSLILFLVISCKTKEKLYRVEQYTFYKNGGREGFMCHDTKKIAPNIYSVKLDSTLANKLGIDSVVFKIVLQDNIAH